MNVVLVLPFAAPIAAAALGTIFRRHLAIQRAITALLFAVLVGSGVVLLDATRDGAAVATRVGDWPAGLAIAFAADGLSALVIAVTTGMAILALLFAVVRDEDRHQLFHPMTAVLLAGVLGSALTADLFNLFVTFEVMLIASYVLLTLRGGRAQVRAGAIYVAVNLTASTALLLGIGLVYGAAGTVHFAELAGVVAEVPTARVGATLVFVAVAIKASLVPMHSWLPRAYVHAGPAVTALFSGLLTKAGVYVLLRLASVMFDGEFAWQGLFLVVTSVTMVVGVLGAVGSTHIRGILAFHMVSQVGYLLLPLGLWSVAGLTAGLVYLAQYVFVKGALFLAAGTVETLTGTGALKELGGMLRTRPWVAMGFLFPALALAGIPPTSGFVGKFLLVRAAFEGQQWIVGAVAVVVSLFTLLSMVKIWTGAFWGEPSERVRYEREALRRWRPAVAGGAGDTGPVSVEATGPQRLGGWRPALLIAPAVAVGLATIVVGIGIESLIQWVEPISRGLLDPSTYLEAVSGA